jgi:ATP-dependent DNA helicase RecQ
MDLTAELTRHFGHPAFREGQREVVEAVLAGRDVVAVMPTGSGKSLCYQLPALLLPGLTLVVSPLIALMKDQVDGLEARRLPATFINSSLPAEERARRLEAMERGAYRLVYFAPERIQSERFVAAVRAAGVARLAVDEAHCISQWGHDFRQDYLRLGPLREALGEPSTIALTATATPEVRQDIIAQLRLREPFVALTGFERPNLRLEAVTCRSKAAKLESLDEVLERWAGPGLVYAATRGHVEEVAAHLAASGQQVAAYHAGLADEERQRVQEALMGDRLRVVVATNAFGMGVDKPDLRFVVHYDIPGTVEAYYQEAGRAGRDGRPALCRLLFSFADRPIQEFFLNGANPPAALIGALFARLQREGPVRVIPEAWALSLGAGRNGMAISTALGILARAGVITRTALESADGSATWRAVAPGPAEALPVDWEWLKRKAALDRRKLERMVAYALGRTCRQAAILEYFAGRPDAAACGRCDRCAEASRPAQDPTPLDQAAVTVVRKALSAVARLDRRFGRTRMIEVLRGDLRHGVRRFQLDQLPTFGALKGRSARWLQALFDTLEEADLVRAIPLDHEGARGSVLTLTESGRAVMLGHRAPALRLPPDAEDHPPSAARRPTEASPLPPAAPAPPDPDLLDRLKTWRKAEADRQGVPAYIVFHNRVLEALAAARPSNRGALATIPGIGPQKLTRYAEALLALLQPGRD